MFDKFLVVILVSSVAVTSCQDTTQHLFYWNGDNTLKREEGEWIQVSAPDGIDRLQHGTWRSWYANGRLQSEVHFRRGRKVGVARYWYPNGQLRQIVPYNDEGMPDGTVKWWDREGKLLKTSQMDNGTGVDYYFDTNGQIKTEVFYVNGIPQGEPIRYLGDESEGKGTGNRAPSPCCEGDMRMK